MTNVFSRVGDRAISVSGTFKAQQFLSFVGTEVLGCDGQAMQNTVFGPNHAYVATDVQQAQWERGVNRDQRSPERDQPCWYPDNFNSYRCTAVDGPVPAVTCQLQPATSTAPLDPESFAAACESDGAARRRDEPGIVCHANEPATPFSKTITLQDNVIGVRYENVPAGHVVTNEFCVDLENSVLRGDEQRKSVTGGAVTLTNAGAAVTVTLISGCEFDASATHVPAPGTSAPPDWGALHRVLTDDLRIRCPGGGSFEYRIDLIGG